MLIRCQRKQESLEFESNWNEYENRSDQSFPFVASNRGSNLGNEKRGKYKKPRPS
jgi:hypothetical protein